MAAIYQWFPTGQLMFLTTTPYPIEVIDGLEFNVQVGFGGLYLIPNESIDIGATMVSMDLRQILKETGPYYEELDIAQTMVSMDLRQLLKTSGPYYEQLDISQTFISMDLVAKLVTVDTPDEALEMNIELSTGECSMTGI